MSSGTLIKVKFPSKHLDDYSSFVPQVVQEIHQLAKPLKGLKVVHLNATALGGGVAEMLRSAVPLQRNIGLDSSWLVIPPEDSFFKITKEIHNFLQGKKGSLTKRQKKIYLDYNQYLTQLLTKIKADIFLIHDPQPAAVLNFFKKKKPKAIWRCHIDTSHPNQSVWRFILPYLKAYDHYVFTMADYINHNFPLKKVSFITPVIDPLSAKNRLMDKKRARQYLKRFNLDIKKPIITQISRFDPWKDPKGVIDAYRLAKKEIPNLQLVLMAQMATDDPEGAQIYQEIKDYVGKEKGIFLLVNLPDNDIAVNAFQTGSDLVIQKSIREGFGLTVTEAMWKRAAVIGGNAGGIVLQIKNGVNGYLVNSPEETAERIVYLLKNVKTKERMARAAHNSVKNKFLIPHQLLNYLRLFKKLIKK